MYECDRRTDGQTDIQTHTAPHDSIGRACIGHRVAKIAVRPVNTVVIPFTRWHSKFKNKIDVSNTRLAENRRFVLFYALIV